MLRIRIEPVAGLLVGQLFHYVDDFDLDGTVDIGSSTLLQGEPHAPVGVIQFFLRGANRDNQFRGDYQKLYDEVASKLRSSTWANRDICRAARHSKPTLQKLPAADQKFFSRL
jgi:hypothetical protein